MENVEVKKVKLTVKKGDVVEFKTGPAGKKVYTGKIVKYPDNKNISIEKDGGEVVVVDKEFIVGPVTV